MAKFVGLAMSCEVWFGPRFHMWLYLAVFITCQISFGVLISHFNQALCISYYTTLKYGSLDMCTFFILVFLG